MPNSATAAAKPTFADKSVVRFFTGTEIKRLSLPSGAL